MSGDTSANTQQDGSPAPKEARGRSTIEFPYSDLDDAIEVTQAVHKVGGTSCTWDQLAGEMQQAPKGGGFRLRVMAARSYGLLMYDRGDIELNDLGLKVIDPKFARAARSEAFLNVPLFRAGFEKFKGTPLPPLPAIERQFEQLGVAPKQKDKARQVFIRSAKQAGYFEISADRLIQPNTNGLGGVVEEPPQDGRAAEKGSKGGGGEGGDNNLHPFIVGLLKTLPEAETKWTLEKRVKWLQAASNIFDLIYTDSEEAEASDRKIVVSIPDPTKAKATEGAA